MSGSQLEGTCSSGRSTLASGETCPSQLARQAAGGALGKQGGGDGPVTAPERNERDSEAQVAKQSPGALPALFGDTAEAGKLTSS